MYPSIIPLDYVYNRMEAKGLVKPHLETGDTLRILTAPQLFDFALLPPCLDMYLIKLMSARDI